MEKNDDICTRKLSHCSQMTARQTNQLKPKARNGKPLMSELLTDARKNIEMVAHAVGLTCH